MDFSTRDKYRHAIESIAKSSPLLEVEVAEKTQTLSQVIQGDTQEILGP